MAQDVRRPVAPARADDHDAEPVGPEILGERAARREPAADERAAGLLRALGVDGAAARAAEVARRAGLHLVAADRAHHPAIAAGGAASALAPLCLHGNHRATALLVFLAAAAGTWVVATDAHSGVG